MAGVELKRMFAIGSKTLETLIEKRQSALDAPVKSRYRYTARHLEKALGSIAKAIEILEND